MQREIEEEVFFLYADDLNCPSTERFIKHTYSTVNTNISFHPVNARLIHCVSNTYFPHSNECAPRTMLALTTFPLHPRPFRTVLLPLMHPNLAMILCYWTAKTILNKEFILMPFHPICLLTSYADTCPAGDAPANHQGYITKTSQIFITPTPFTMTTAIPSHKPPVPSIFCSTGMAKQPHWETQPTYTAPARNLDDLEHSIEKADRTAAQIRTLIAGEACRAMYRKGSTSLQPFSANSYGLNQLDTPDFTATDPAFGNPVQLKTWTGP